MKSSRLAVVFLVVVNLIPIFGVLFFDWDLFSLMMLYWMENIIVGLFNPIKMAFATGVDEKLSEFPLASVGLKIFLIPFFTFHYGLFCLVHGLFIVAFFGQSGFFSNSTDGSVPNELFSGGFIDTLANNFGWALLSMVLSHGLSLALNYFGQREYLKANIVEMMFQPYKRIVVLHLTILLGAFLAMGLGSPMIALIFMAILKIIVDVISHVVEHMKFQKRVATTI